MPQPDRIFKPPARRSYGSERNSTRREPLGLETCRRAQVESLGAERPQGRTIDFNGKDRATRGASAYAARATSTNIQFSIFNRQFRLVRVRSYRSKIIKIINMINFFLRFTGFVVSNYRDLRITYKYIYILPVFNPFLGLCGTCNIVLNQYSTQSLSSEFFAFYGKIFFRESMVFEEMPKMPKIVGSLRSVFIINAWYFAPAQAINQ